MTQEKPLPLHPILALKEAQNSHGEAGMKRLLVEDALAFADRLEIAHRPDRSGYYREKAVEFFEEAERLRKDGQLDTEGSPQ